MGLLVSSLFLLTTFFLKVSAFSQFEATLKNQHMDYLNTVLWSAKVKTEQAFLLGNYSLFDNQSITFESYTKNLELLGDLIEKEAVQRMIAFTENWNTISKKNDRLVDFYFLI
jgi:inner membrane protein